MSERRTASSRTIAACLVAAACLVPLLMTAACEKKETEKKITIQFDVSGEGAGTAKTPQAVKGGASGGATAGLPTQPPAEPQAPASPSPLPPRPARQGGGAGYPPQQQVAPQQPAAVPTTYDFLQELQQGRGDVFHQGQ